MRWLVSFLLLGLCALAECLSSSGTRLLVAVEDSSEQDKYSQLWADLKERGYTITFEAPKSDKLQLTRYGELLHDHLIILPLKSKKGLGPNLAPKILLDFLQRDGNVLLALSGEAPVPNALVSLLLEFDISLPLEKTSVAVDHFHYDGASAADKHDVLLLPRPSPARKDIKDFFGGEGLLAIPRAIPQALGTKSPLLAPILKGMGTTYAYSPKTDEENAEDFATGSQLSLVTAMQARNSARFTVFGSAEALQNKWFDAKVKQGAEEKTGTANRAFAKAVTGWTFKELGILKVGKVEYYLNENGKKVGNLNPPIVRIKNDVTFHVELSEWEGSQYTAPSLPESDALQVEFTMLSPFHRLPLKAVRKTHNGTLYGASFMTPDQHGIFSFRVNYKRPFLSNIEVKEEVTVRHFAHDEYPRSWRITGGWVWIAGIWVTVGGWIVFCAIWLYSAPVKKATQKKKQ